MKILITGTKGYIANNIEKTLKEKTTLYETQKLSIRKQIRIPKETDVIIHTAALVHKKENNYLESDYFQVNYDLTLQLAKTAKESGVNHFIFFSTMAVYGEQGHSLFDAVINRSSPLRPITYYGKSKLAAENKLMSMQDDHFIVSIIRPPMVYGPNCPGNYAILSKIAKITPFFPSVKNQRSMIFIKNLTEFVYQLINNRDSGIFHPQDEEYIQTSEMVKKIGSIHNRKIFSNKLIGTMIIKLLSKQKNIAKVFGSLTYDKELSFYRDNSYQMYTFDEAIRISELKNKRD